MARQRRQLDDELADIMTMARTARTSTLTVPAMAPVGPDMIEDDAILNEHLAAGAVAMENLSQEIQDTITNLADNEQELADAAARLGVAETRLDSVFGTVDDLTEQVGSAQSIADNALTMAGSKSRVYYDTGDASGTASNGDTWRKVDASGNVIAEWRWADGWKSQQVTSNVIANLDVGKLTLGTALIKDAVVENIAARTSQFITADIGKLTVTGEANLAEVVARRIAANTGSFIELNTDQLRAGSALIGGTLIANNAINADKLAANAVTAGKIAAGSVNATHIAAGSITADLISVKGRNVIPDPVFLDSRLNGLRSTSGLTPGLVTFVPDDSGTGNIMRFSETSATYRTIKTYGDDAAGRAGVVPGDRVRFSFQYRARGSAIAGANASHVRFSIHEDGADKSNLRHTGIGNYTTVNSSGTAWNTYFAEYLITQPDTRFIRPNIQVRNPGFTGDLELRNPVVEVTGELSVIQAADAFGGYREARLAGASQQSGFPGLEFAHKFMDQPQPAGYFPAAVTSPGNGIALTSGRSGASGFGMGESRIDLDLGNISMSAGNASGTFSLQAYGGASVNGVPIGDDTGWQFITYQNNWANYGNGFIGLRYKRLNGVVFIQGTIKGGAVYSIIGQLPAGFRPSLPSGIEALEFPITAQQAGTRYSGTLFVYATGSLRYDAPPGVWNGADRVSINSSFPIV